MKRWSATLENEKNITNRDVFKLENFFSQILKHFS